MSHYPSSEWTWGIGLVVLLIIIIYGVLRSRRRGPATRQLTEDATRELYREEEEHRTQEHRTQEHRGQNDPTR